MNIEDMCFGFIGLGLIGGSVAKAIRCKFPNARIIVYNRTFSTAEAAKQDGVADIICQDVDEAFSICDYIFLCMPVSFNAQYLERLAPIIKDSCILTDVGSSKTDIHEHVAQLGLEASFIGGHPMAGSDKTGYLHASEHLLEQAYYFITPTSQSDAGQIENYRQLVQALGAIPLILDFKRHDYMTAAISHVPHLIASSLAHLASQLDTDGMLKQIAAGGFRDTTRIAASSPDMWQQICLTNSENVCEILDSYIALLHSVREMISNHAGDDIYHFLKEARAYRSSFPDNHTGN